ncbi:ATP-grasp domain-containing protein [Blastococcus xanthinilyticus]|uniref:Carbamoyl-phosphate synthase large subunit n=1 Tax=Blastococcus xanthinilyticus TaxID=1564164 RepID=A0A5S5CM24_9ACTN|nr:ATP-grasp domain-containing protein [Blastococcus xanthinilyticus]TYP82791.1 carbamoyl-phosphate synthase large subunit [Blastococcus xanthinilyticus]
MSDPTPTRVLVTGAGGPAGIAVLRSLARRPDVELLAADMDRYASGLYLVGAAARHLVRPGLAEDFVDDLVALCERERVDVLFSTVDVELPRLAAERKRLDAVGTTLAAPSLETLEVCLDKYALARRCADVLPTPRTALLGDTDPDSWDYPVIVKPRRGAGSRGVHLVEDAAALRALGRDEDILVQAHLPGDEYSVDTLADADGHVVAAVPRSRLRVDSGVSVAGATVADPELEETARRVAAAIGLVGVANVQLRRDADGRPALLEVNPRFPGAMPLTVAAGVDMPSLALDLALGRPLPSHVPFTELAVVRYLEDVFVAPADLVPSEAPR